MNVIKTATMANLQLRYSALTVSQIFFSRSFSVSSAVSEKMKGIKTFKIYRYNPDKPKDKPFMQEYKVDMSK